MSCCAGEPRRQFSGRFHVRIPPELHATISAAAADGKSLNQWVVDELSASVAGSASSPVPRPLS